VTSIAHLSDTHFGTEIPAVADALRKALESLRPELALVTGDITQRARPHQFAAARAFLQRLPVPATIVMPGNHDIPLFNLFVRALDPYRHFRQAFGARSSIWSDARVTVIALDTTLPQRHTRGRLDLRQLADHIAALQPRRPTDIVVAAIHQPLHTSWAQDRDEALLNSDEAALAFARAGVDMVLSGHVHVPIVATTQDLFPRLPRHFILAGAGTAISHRTRAGAPNSFNLLRFGEPDGNERIAVDRYCFDEASARFVQERQTSFITGADGWVAQAPSIGQFNQ
jgi:3',5'-cyclic AMP phosphodiesterase CpdA